MEMFSHFCFSERTLTV